MATLAQMSWQSFLRWLIFLCLVIEFEKSSRNSAKPWTKIRMARSHLMSLQRLSHIFSKSEITLDRCPLKGLYKMFGMLSGGIAGLWSIEELRSGKNIPKGHQQERRNLCYSRNFGAIRHSAFILRSYNSTVHFNT